VFDPDNFWAHVLPGPAATTEPDSFDARVERVWERINAAHFSVEEHERLREALKARIEKEPVDNTAAKESAS
jgi:hypothetical protein